MIARMRPAVYSGRSVICSSPRSLKVYISFETMSVVSPIGRAKTSVNSKIGVVAAAGEADIRLARLARAVDDAADHREGERCRDVGELLLENADGLDDVEILPGARRARDDGDAAAAQPQRLQHVVADLDLL